MSHTDRAFPVGRYTRLANVPVDRVVTVLAPKVTPPVRPRGDRRTGLRTAHRPRTADRSRGSGTTPRSGRFARDRRRSRCRRAICTTCRSPSSGLHARTHDQRSRRSDQLRRLPPAALAGVVQREPRATFGLLSDQLRALCYSPDYTARGRGPGRLGNRHRRCRDRAGGTTVRTSSSTSPTRPSRRRISR